MFLLIIASVTDANFSAADGVYGFDLRLFGMLLLAEPHFAFTIPLLFGYRKLFLEQKFFFVIVPVLIVALSAVLFWTWYPVFSIFFLLANVYHVNCQSFGFFIHQAKPNKNIASSFAIALHIFALIFFTIHFLDSNYRLLQAFLSICAFLIFSIIISKDFVEKKTEGFLSCVQGFLIFLPVALFSDLLVSFSVGISIHYLQYIVISWKVCTKSFKISVFQLLFFLIAYSLFTGGALSGILTQDGRSVLVFIPTIFQLLHFYFDGFIWKRSNPRISQAMGKALF